MHDFEETGFDKGMEKGIEQGKKETTMSIIKNMLGKNKTIQEISEITELSIEKINNIIKENNL